MYDEYFMARALQLARKGRFTTHPNPSVGCVIVRDGQVIGEGFHQRAGEPHAEVHALQMAGEKAHGATAYVTLEPCSHFGRTPPCCDTLVAAGIRRVVAAMEDPNPEIAGRGLYRLHEAGIEVRSDLMREEAEALNRGFLKRMRTGFPFVQLKLGASLDGRTAMPGGESQWITSAQSRRDVQRYRAQSHAILSTSATVLADDPALTVRWSEVDTEIRECYQEEQLLRQPVRVILDAHNGVTPQHRIIQQPGETWLARIQPGDELWPDTVSQFTVPVLNSQLDLVALMMMLGKRQINSVWVEAGATLAGAMLTAGLVDELIIYLAPMLLGDAARGLCRLPGLSQLAEAPRLRFVDLRHTGPDVRLTLVPYN
ncbi:bifunctional diaminohydroxyphosphoribosylaminopyrimidine deaminase/5-amino-6-(5-phosphoribosylamino)uracil reductase RibD [Enterobacteriaceae bacterium LUAb1]